MRKILQLGDPRLEKKSIPVVDPAASEVKKLIDDMLQVLESVKEHSAGLSAPQIGENVRIAICRRVDIEEDLAAKREELGTSEDAEELEPIWEIMINPEILSKSTETSEAWEGCLSINKGDLFGEVKRAKWVEVEFTDLEGVRKKLKAPGYFSHVVQHEIDHLDGVLFIRYIKDPTLLYTSDELDKLNSEENP